MTDLLIASQVLLWLAVIGFGIVLYALSRQVGALFARVAPAGALAVNELLEPGARAPELELRDIRDKVCHIGGERERLQLVFFLAPDCPICKSLVPAILKIAADENADLVVASDGGALQEHLTLQREHALEAVPYVLSEELGRACAVSKLPYAVLIDPAGNVAGLGIVNTREHVESLFNAVELGVATVQEFVSRQP